MILSEFTEILEWIKIVRKNISRVERNLKVLEEAFNNQISINDFFKEKEKETMFWNYNDRTGIYTVNDATFPFAPNFSGEERMYNDAGRRNFVVDISEDLYNELSSKGVRVRVRPPRDDYENPQYLLTVKVYIPEQREDGRRGRSPEIWIRTEGSKMHQLDGDLCHTIDDEWGKRHVRKADFEFHIGSSKRYPSNPPSAYLDSIVVTIDESQLIRRYREMDDELPM